jgi:demethylmenaquinone methyltransferase/2-methoxy-6-polyprenyl-1,4-benzoquinol methylase
MRLPLADASADVVSIAFGIRNVADPGAALREFVRVLRPGGRLVVLEFSEPSNPVIRRASKLWTDHVMPRTASWIARDRSGAYRYLPRSVGTFWDRQQLQNAMAGTGLGEVVCRPMTFGVACVYRGVRGAQ